MKNHNIFLRFIVDMQAKASSKGADSGLNKLGWALIIVSLGWAISAIIAAIAPAGLV